MTPPRLPALLCFNLRREHAGESEIDLAAKLAHARTLLAQARMEGWRVAHAHTIARPDRIIASGSLAGLEALVNEPVFALHQNCAFAEPALLEFVSGGPEAPTHLIGAMYSRAGLATLLLADELGLSVNVIAEACFRARDEASMAARAEAFVRTRRQTAGDALVHGGNVICLETRRHERV